MDDVTPHDKRAKLLIIGAGPVGLAMANALRQHSIFYEQVDAKDGLGGNWHSGLYQGVHLNSSKRSTAFAGYPMPDDYPLFPSAQQTKVYLEDYAAAHGIASNIRFSTRVTQAIPLEDDNWQVQFSDGTQAIYKGLVICNGHHWHPHMPELPSSFAGQLFHSKDYVELKQLAGKRVLVIGAGNSACDIVCDAARVGKTADICMRRGYWFMPRLAFGRPLHDLPIWHLPVTLQRLILRTIIWVTIGDYRKYGLEKPDHRLFDRHTMFGAEMIDLISKGRINPRRSILNVSGHTITFSDGAKADYDVIVAATGFKISFPFLPEGIVPVKNNALQVYGHAFPVGIKNLYLVGGNQPRAGFGYLLTPLADLYARVIKLQDELEHPMGSVLEFMGEKIPKTHLVDPGGASREILLSRLLLPYARWQGRRLAKRRPHVPSPFAIPAPLNTKPKLPLPVAAE